MSIALFPGLLDHRDYLGPGPVVAPVDDRHVRELHRNLGAAPYLDGLLHHLHVPSGQHPRVCRVEGPVVPCDRLSQRDDLVGRGVRGRRDGESRTQAEGALLYRLGGQAGHLADLVGVRGTVLQRACSGAKGRVAHLRSDVDADAAGLQDVRPLVQRAPRPRPLVLEHTRQRSPDGVRPGAPRREGRVAAVAGNLRCHPLVRHALAAGIVEQRQVRVRVHVR